MFYGFTSGMSKENLNEDMQRKYFPLIATIFVFILVSNLIGYIPLPINSGETFKLFGASIPSLQIYAADTNVAFPLILALGVFVLFTYEGVRHHGPIGYLKSLMPGGIKGPIVGLIFPIEILSNFLRLISLTVQAVGQSARRSHADRVHGRRARCARRGSTGSNGSCCRQESRSTCSRPC